MVQIKVNVINEMHRLRETAYVDGYSWVDELIQNTQRAGAQNVSISVTHDSVTVEDDGAGCTDPQLLFEKGVSQWGASAAGENPFGEGLFSVLLIADEMIVESVGFKAIFDIEKMFRDRTTDCITVLSSTKTIGFTVQLNKLRNSYSYSKAYATFVEAVKYINDINFTINNEAIETKSIMETDGSIFARRVKQDNMNGWIRPYCWEDSGTDCMDGHQISVYCNGRKVRDHITVGVIGAIMISNNVVDLRSPDRRDFIYNDKYQAFVATLRALVKQVYIDVLRKGSDKDIDRYASNITSTLSVSEYSEYMRFIVVNDQYDLAKIAPPAENEDVFNIDDTLENTSPIYGLSRPLPTDSLCVQCSISKNKMVEETGRTGIVLDYSSPMLFIGIEEINTYSEQMAVALYYNIPVVIARNKLETSTLESLPKATHISEINDAVKLTLEVHNIGPINEKERHVMRIFDTLCKWLGINYNLFEIGNIKMYKSMFGNSKEASPSLACAYRGAVFIDRNALYSKTLRTTKDKSSRLSASDKAFICMNMETIAHELAHVIYDTTDNTKAHAEMQLNITNCILNYLFKDDSLAVDAVLTG